MPQSRDTDESTSAADRALLVDLLYGELGEPEVAHAEERLGGDEELQGEFAAFGRIREMMSALPDEEPPTAISAKLLHAAAQQAASTASGPVASVSAGRREESDEPSGLWAWLTGLFRPLVMYPGLAAATSLVLVAGVAGAFYVSGRVEPAQSPMVSSEPAFLESGESKAAAPSAPSNDPEASAAQPSGAALQQQSGDGFADEAPEPVSGADSDAPDDTTGGMSDRRAESRPAESRRPESGREDSDDSRRRARIDGLEGDVGSLEGAYKSGFGGSAGGKASTPASTPPARSAGPRSRKRPSKKSGRSSRSGNKPASKSIDIGLEEARLAPVPDRSVSDQEAPNAEPEAAEEDEAGAEADEQAPAEKGKKSPRRTRGASQTDKKDSASPATARQSRLRSLHDEAKDAARANNCSSVRSIGGEIEKLDRVYYRERFLRDKALSRCFGKKR